ncbi:hypothetical protein [Streptomyces griseofuscus]
MPATALPPKPRIVYPRPPVTALHHQLFVEPAYEGGEPYAQDDDEDDGAA